MNRYPLWKYAILLVALLIGLLYTLPNLFGEAPAVQVSSAKVTVKIDQALQARIESALQQAGVKPDFVQFDGNSIKARFGDTDTQLKAKDAISKALNADPADPSYIVALNLLSRSPHWLSSLLMMVAMFVVVFFVMIRPQMKRQKEHKAMMEALAKGDEVVTAGGIVGKVTKLADSFVHVEVASGVELQLQRSAVTQVLPKGSLK